MLWSVCRFIKRSALLGTVHKMVLGYLGIGHWYSELKEWVFFYPEFHCNRISDTVRCMETSLWLTLRSTLLLPETHVCLPVWLALIHKLPMKQGFCNYSLFYQSLSSSPTSTTCFSPISQSNNLSDPRSLLLILKSSDLLTAIPPFLLTHLKSPSLDLLD